MLTNCKNCGGVLKDMKCPYCGSEYEYIPTINDFRQVIKLNVYGHIRKFYLSEIRVEPVFIDTTSFLDVSGRYVINRGHEEMELRLISYE